MANPHTMQFYKLCLQSSEGKSVLDLINGDDAELYSAGCHFSFGSDCFSE